MNTDNTKASAVEAARDKTILDIVNGPGMLVTSHELHKAIYDAGFAAASAERECVEDENGLLPCPFCGESPDRIDQFRVQCVNGECGMYIKLMNRHDWNRRTPYAPKGGTNDE